MPSLIENATVVPAAVLNPKRKKGRKIRMISRFERRRTAYRLNDLIGKLIKTIVVVIATPVGRENQLLREEVLRHAKIEVGPRTEIGIEIDHEKDRGTGREIDRAIDHETEIDGKFCEFFNFVY